MIKNELKIVFVSLAVIFIISSVVTVMALPAAAVSHTTSTTSNTSMTPSTNTNQDMTSYSSPSTATTATTHQPTKMPPQAVNGQSHLASGLLIACQHRQTAIDNIISRITDRSQAQLTLFGTIASRVEAFYVKQGKTVSNYQTLVSQITTTANQATTDFNMVESVPTFDCTSADPVSTINTFRGYLSTEITDLQNYRLSVKNLIVAVAKANGVTISSSTNSSTSNNTRPTSTSSSTSNTSGSN